MWGKTGKLGSKRRATSFYLSPQPPFIAARPRFVGHLGADRLLSEWGKRLAAMLSRPRDLPQQSRGSHLVPTRCSGTTESSLPPGRCTRQLERDATSRREDKMRDVIVASATAAAAEECKNALL